MVKLSQFRNIPCTIRRDCAICREPLGDPLIELPEFPLSEIYINKPVSDRLGFIDQFFHVCPHCGHGQISRIINQKILYSESYYFRTSTSGTARKSNDFFLQFIRDTIKKTKFNTIVEIGCNDLYLLNSLKSYGNRLIGIDPVLKSKSPYHSDEKIYAIGDFVENVDLSDISKGTPVLVLSSHTLEHMENPRQFIQMLFNYFDTGDVFIFQFPGFDTLIDNYRFDQIFHQHLQYFSLKSFLFLLHELNGEPVGYRINPHHWGSMLVAFRKRSRKQTPSSEKKNSVLVRSYEPEYIQKRYDAFRTQMKLVNDHLASIKNQKIFGYGAALMLPILAYHLNNDLSCLECVFDDDKTKQGLYYLNLPVKICSLKKPEIIKKSVIFITAIDNASAILPKAIALNPAKIILPVHSIS